MASWTRLALQRGGLLLVTINRRRRQTTITTQPAPSDSRSTTWSGYRRACPIQSTWLTRNYAKPCRRRCCASCGSRP